MKENNQLGQLIEFDARCSTYLFRFFSFSSSDVSEISSSFESEFSFSPSLSEPTSAADA